MSADNHGYISLHRKIMQNFLFKEKRQFSRFEAWIYLLMSANHSDTEVLLGNQLIKVKKGSFITSEIKLMAEFQWSKSKLRAFLSLLESQSMIEKITDTKKTTLTIVKYSDYQELQTAKKPRKDREPTAKRPRADTDNNENNYNNDNNENNTNPTEVELVFDTRFDFSGFNDSFSIGKLWTEWIEYKKLQHKETYKTTKSEQTAINNLQKLCRGDTETAKQIIEQSIGNLWKGLFELKQQSNPHNKNNNLQTQLDYEKQHINSHVYKSLRGFEQSRSISAGTLKVARHYLSQTTTVIDVHEFARLLDQIENAGGIPDTVDFGTPLWLGLRESEQNDNSGHLRLSFDSTGEFND